MKKKAIFASEIKAILSNIAHATRAAEPEGQLGMAIRNKARQRGMVLAPSGAEPEGLTGAAHRLLSKLGILPETRGYYEALAYPEKTKVVVAPMVRPGTEAKQIRTVVQPIDDAIGSDKWREATELKGIYPDTDLLSHHMHPDIPANRILVELQRTLQDRFKGRDWLIKERNAGMTAPEDLVTRHNLGRNIDRILKEGPENFIVQEKHDISVPGYQSAVDTGVKSLMKGVGIDAATNMMRGTNEYRIHGMGGAVIPHASVHRGSLLKIISNYINPIRSRELQAAEEHAQKVIDAMPLEHRKGFYGMDIGIDARTGRPFLIEGNPAGEGGMSGMTRNWLVQDAIQAAVKGRLPNYVKARNAAYASVPVVGGGLAINSAMQPEEPKPYSMEYVKAKMREVLGRRQA